MHMIIVLIMMLIIIMRKYSLSVLMKADVKQTVKHTIIYPAVTEFFLRNVHILVAYLLDYQLTCRSYVWSTINLAFHRHTYGPTR